MASRDNALIWESYFPPSRRTYAHTARPQGAYVHQFGSGLSVNNNPPVDPGEIGVLQHDLISIGIVLDPPQHHSPQSMDMNGSGLHPKDVWESNIDTLKRSYLDQFNDSFESDVRISWDKISYYKDQMFIRMGGPEWDRDAVKGMGDVDREIWGVHNRDEDRFPAWQYIHFSDCISPYLKFGKVERKKANIQKGLR